jgi:ParB family chromosome partitioning protein
MLSKKKVLGRGLGALIGDNGLGDSRAAISAVAEKASKYFLCPIEDVIPGRLQPRKTFDEAKLSELSASIMEKGVIEPLIVKRSDLGGYELIAGERRLRASKLAGLSHVPVVVSDVTDEESLELAVIENIQREDLNAIEEAEAYKTLMGFGLTQDDVAKKVGRERATVANYLRLLKLPVEVKDEMAKGLLSMGHARALLSLEHNVAAMRELAREIITKSLSVRTTEALVNRRLKGAPIKPGRKGSSAMSEVEEELRRALGTKVAIKERKGRGKIEISYFSVDERERLIDIFRNASKS